MRKLFVILFATVLSISGAWAQCTPDFNMTTPGFAPDPDSLDCIVVGDTNDITIFFKNFNQLVVFGQNVTVDSIRIDSVNNLPCNLQWASNKGTVPFGNSESGCVAVTGVTYDQPGTYLLDIVVTAWINGQSTPIQQKSDVIGVGFYLNVIANANDACVSADTSQANELNTASVSPCISGINERTRDNISTLDIAPNPFSGVAIVSFTATEHKAYTANLYDLSGKVVISENINVAAGQNRFEINAESLSPGVYFYTITDGVKTTTHKVVVTN